MPNSETVLDSRVDSYALDMLGNMGYDVSRLPDSLVKLYTIAKRKKDVVFPSRVSVETIAVLATLSDMVDKRGEYAVVEVPKPVETPAKEKKVEGAK